MRNLLVLVGMAAVVAILALGQGQQSQAASFSVQATLDSQTQVPGRGDGDAFIEIGEGWEFTMTVTVTNYGPGYATDMLLKDPLNAELELVSTTWSEVDVETTTRGRSEKVTIYWYIGGLAAYSSATLQIVAQTDVNPAGNDTPTSVGPFALNEGATLSGTVGGVPYKGTFTFAGIEVDVTGVEAD